jgi:hypothetical protein
MKCAPKQPGRPKTTFIILEAEFDFVATRLKIGQSETIIAGDGHVY